MFALHWADAALVDDALARLVELVESVPLEPLGPRQRPNSRQRAEAAQQVALWLVARECLKTADRQELGEKLADRAVAAAQRQVDLSQASSILYERAKLALDRGDKAAAKLHLDELIDIAVAQPRVAKTARTPGSRKASLRSARRCSSVPAR